MYTRRLIFDYLITFYRYIIKYVYVIKDKDNYC
jgi:hypothetical protein